MPVHNTDVARIFTEVADLLEIEGDNPYRVRAYRTAAQTVRQLSKNVADLVHEDANLTALEGVGDDLAERIREIVETGSLALLDELRRRTPPALADLMDVEGLGPKRVKRLYDELGVTTRDDLRRAAETGAIRGLEGFGETMEQNILDHVDRETETRMLWSDAEPVARDLEAYLSDIDGVERVEVAGSYRRRKETVGDLDVLALGTDGAAIIEQFVSFGDVEDVLSQGSTRSSVVFTSGLQVDLRVVPPESYGAALLYFTGSKAHTIELRDRALDRGLKINEYGVFDTEGEDERVGGATEEEMYEVLDLPYIVPELREQRGEIAAAEAGTLPALIEPEDIRGNFHTHTTDSDGTASMEAMATAAVEYGLDYLAITDHSSFVGVVKGLDEEALRKQIDRVRRLDEEIDALRLLAGIEVDILEDGTLDLSDDVLARLDVCVASVHTNFGLPEDDQTERILRAMDHPHVHILAHPTGRRLNRREPYAVDVPRLVEGAAERGCVLELNGTPDRLDLNDTYCKAAKEAGAPIAISADAHRPDTLDDLRYGVAQARRGWLETDDVVNTRPWDEAAALFDR